MPQTDHPVDFCPAFSLSLVPAKIDPCLCNVSTSMLQRPLPASQHICVRGSDVQTTLLDGSSPLANRSGRTVTDLRAIDFGPEGIPISGQRVAISVHAYLVVVIFEMELRNAIARQRAPRSRFEVIGVVGQRFRLVAIREISMCADLSKRRRRYRQHHDRHFNKTTNPIGQCHNPPFSDAMTWVLSRSKLDGSRS
jgi:hypothetical protein